MKLMMLCFTFAATALLQSCAMFSSSGSTAHASRDRRLFDEGWEFHAGEVANGQTWFPMTNDKPTTWELVNLPHDFMIEGKGQPMPTPNPNAPARGRGRGNAAARPTAKEGPFDPRSPGSGDVGFLNAGIGWYRKSFKLPEGHSAKRVFIDFDGVYMNSEVWLNGKSLGKRPYGYSGFQYEITDDLKYGGDGNVLAVKVSVPQPSSRWYSGAGIYRHVWITAMEPTHFEHWGTIVTTPEITDAHATVGIKTTAALGTKNGGGIHAETIIKDREGKVVTHASSEPTAAGASGAETKSLAEFNLTLSVDNPHRWSIEDPYLYSVEVHLMDHGKLVDIDRQPLGIRTSEFTKEGFFLNGKRVPIQGVCDHHDLGPLGAAAYDRAIIRQLEILKTMGCNAIRTSHNPPAPALLDACDRLGFVVMDESFDEWKQNKTRFGYGQFFDEWSERDIKDMVRRDRNHPSIIMWSVGNEIPEQSTANAEEMCKRLVEFVKAEDPTRPTVSAMNNITRALTSGFANPLDLLGANYNVPNYPRLTTAPKPLLGSETSSNYSSRDEYNLVLRGGKIEILHAIYGQPLPVGADGKAIQHCTSYDLDFPSWGNTAEVEFLGLRKSPQIAGEFVWTGFDYIGEPTPFPWPNRSSSFGIVDICGFPKDRYYLYQSQWTQKPMVHLLPHWNWPEEFQNKEIPVWAYTNADEVELFLNGNSLGTRDWKTTTDKLHLAWQVPYEPGTLRAVAKKDGRVVATDEIQTAGKPARIELSADRKDLRANGVDLSFVTARIVDAQGRLCRADGNAKISFKLTGKGSIAGVDNGDPTNHEPFIGPTHNAAQHLAFHGLCLAIVKSDLEVGEVTLEATAPGLIGGGISIALH